jgi:uncharacterized membrane protein YphA (DoxX/SURF4 family)
LKGPSSQRSGNYRPAIGGDIQSSWGAFFLPKGIEYTFSLLAAAVALFISGGGKFSLDTRLAKK